jgi:hypothetical protein
MRVLTIVAVALVGGAGGLAAQHGHQLELGAFGTFTRYDPLFGIKNQFGGGGRLGYFLSDYFGLEVSADMASPTARSGLFGTAVTRASASLLLNSGGERNIMYLRGGYTRFRWGGYSPYGWLDEIHGGLGDRVFLGSRVALRLEAVAYYALNDWAGSKRPLDVTGSAGLSLLLFGGGGRGGRHPGGPEIPQHVRDSILAAGGTLPQPTSWTRPSYSGHRHQLEVSAFGAFTRYDPVYGINNRAGGGARVGYFLSNYVGLEVAADMASPYAKSGAFGTAITRASASLVLNSGGERNVMYVLGGYTRFRWGGYSPYGWLNEAHGGIGDRIFLNGRVAVRLEALAYYALNDWAGNNRPLDVTGSAGLSLFLFGGGGRRPEVPPLTKAQRDSILAAGGTLPPEGAPTRETFTRGGLGWPHQWFWGGQAGVLVFNTPTDGFSAEPTFGGHWLITGKRTALYVAYEQSFFLTDRHATVVEPDGTVEPGNVAFHGLRRIMAGVLAYPVQKAIQPFGGGGFAIMQVLDPVATCTGCTTTNAILTQTSADNAASTAVFFWMGGVEVRQGRMTLYGHYILTSAASKFLLSGVTHTFQGGLRYSFGSSREEVTAEQ